MSYNILTVAVVLTFFMGADCAKPVTTRSVSVAVKENLAIDAELAETNAPVSYLPSDVSHAQIGPRFHLGKGEGSVLFAFVLQKNMNVPLIILPAGMESGWGGVIASADDGKNWEKFLLFTNPSVEDLGVVRANPVGMFIEDGRLYVDVADALGAGSGEGQMTRFVLSDDGRTWTNGGCWYYVPEKYVARIDVPLAESDDCVIVP